MIAFLEAGDAVLLRARQVVAAPPSAALGEPAHVTLKAPIPRRGKIICIGFNYRDYDACSNLRLPTFLVVLAKILNFVIGLDQAIVLPIIS